MRIVDSASLVCFLACSFIYNGFLAFCLCKRLGANGRPTMWTMQIPLVKQLGLMNDLQFMGSLVVSYGMLWLLNSINTTND